MNARCWNTGRVLIGRTYIRPPQRIESDALTVQAALLDPRTARRRPLVSRVLAWVWRWM